MTTLPPMPRSAVPIPVPRPATPAVAPQPAAPQAPASVAQPIAPSAPGMLAAPMAAQPVMAPPSPLPGWIYQLGSQTQLGADGLVRLNLPLVETIVRFREAAVPLLCQFLAGTQNILAMAEGLYTAQRLAEERVSNVGMIYGVTKHWHTQPHPLVQIYLSGFYRKLNAPETLGPLATMLLRNALQPGPPIPPAFDPQEEVGGAILDLIAHKAADETMRRIQYLQAQQAAQRPQ